jgi:thioredoxin reductase
MLYDTIIIGGSFGGLSAATQLARARRRILIIDSRKPRNRFSTTSHGFLGQDGKNYASILDESIHQICRYPTVDYVTNEACTIHKGNVCFIVTSLDGQEHRSLRLVLATGLMDELPLIDGLQERWGKTVLHCPYCHGYEIVGSPIGVIASHPMSAHQAAIISDWGPSIFFTQGKFKPTSEQKKQLFDKQIQIEQSPIVEIVGAPPEIESVRLSDNRLLSISALFITPKIHMASSLAEQLGCEFIDGPLGPYLQVDDWNQTSVQGVFAAGDVVQPLHNATLASAAGVIAGAGAHQSLIFDRIFGEHY